MFAKKASTELTITNPLTIYQNLLATQTIRPDLAQHRLALQLQKLYFRLKDYRPEVEYRQRLDHINQAITKSSISARDGGRSSRSRIISSLWNGRTNEHQGPTLSLTRTVSMQESAMTIDSPKGMMLYGEVGRGKSMLLDLLAGSLPSDRKCRWHFNNFMLDMFRKLEQLRKDRLELSTPSIDQEHSVLTLARDMISTTPILFLDEFQFPDRVASKLLSSFLTSFFHLGGVLLATSNRMPEQLAQAAGVEYAREPVSTVEKVGNLLGYRSRNGPVEQAAKTDFGQFLAVLKARCDVWEIEGERDWRRGDISSQSQKAVAAEGDSLDDRTVRLGVSPCATDDQILEDGRPMYYYLTSGPSDKVSAVAWERAVSRVINRDKRTGPGKKGLPWRSDTLNVYGRKIQVQACHEGVALLDFANLCELNLGPADYISLASKYHTLILDNVPVLTDSLKNEARRFITLVDALYEARCRLLLRAAAQPDDLFFPERRANVPTEGEGSKASYSGNEVYQETLAEIYQDATNPFRPNVASYKSDDPFRNVPSSLGRSVLADEDADFGPTYGNGRGHGRSAGEQIFSEQDRTPSGPDFTRTGHLTGEDERFAYKRARSRLWELCGDKWWNDRSNDPAAWWKPVSREIRHWEGKAYDPPTDNGVGNSISPDLGTAVSTEREQLFRHGASPFRTHQEPPPKFSWVHSWGLMKWGKKGGDWGEGVDAKKIKMVAKSSDKR